MWPWPVFLIALLSGLCFSTRIVWRIAYPQFGNDTWGLLNIARSIRRHSFRLPRIIGNYFNDEEDWDYPPLFPYILATMEEKTALRVNGYIPAAIDTVTCAVTGAFLAWLPGSGLIAVGLTWPVMPGLDAVETAALVMPAVGMLTVIFTPMTYIDSFQHLSARPLANLWMALALMALYVYSMSGDRLALVLMMAPVTLIFVTHKFTLQALVFLLMGASVYMRDPLPLAVLGAGFLLAVLFTGGHYLKVLRGHLAFLNFYRMMGARKYPGKYAIDRERLRKLVRLDATGNPWIYMLVIVLWSGGWPPGLLAVLALVSVTVYLLVSLNPLLFLGEPERYFEAAMFPLAVLIPLVLMGGSWLPWLIFLALLVLCSARIVREMGGREEQMFDKTRVIEHFVDPEWLRACEFMKGRPGSRIITVPENLQWATSYFTGKQTQGTNSALQYIPYMEEFPATPQNLRELAVKYRVDMIFMAKASMNGYDMLFAKKTFENERYIIYDSQSNTILK
jgi:hypothetical protein